MQALAQALTGLASPAAPSCLPDTSSDESKPKVRKIRCADRAIRWRADLERHYGRLIVEAKTPADQTRIEESYNADLKRGPDFSRVRRNANTFGMPVIRGLDRNLLAKVVFNFERIAHGLWRTDRKSARDHGRKIKRTLPASVLPVLKALVRLTVKHAGRVFPSLEGLAFSAGCSRATCIEAVKLLEAWGFLKITRRCKRVQTTVGMRLVQDTSVYELQEPQGLAAMAARIFGLDVGPRKSGISSESKIPPASSTKINSSNEEVRVADRTPHEAARLLPLPSNFDTPRRRIHWSELIRPKR
jgi:biotin operon repressor